VKLVDSSFHLTSQCSVLSATAEVYTAVVSLTNDTRSSVCGIPYYLKLLFAINYDLCDGSV